MSNNTDKESIEEINTKKDPNLSLITSDNKNSNQNNKSKDNSENSKSDNTSSNNEENSLRSIEESDNEAEQLIRLHYEVSDCSLMTEGYHIIKKKYYFCTCDPDCQMPLCEACLRNCHKEHWKKKNISEIQTDIRNALCFCGLHNHILPEKVNKNDFLYEDECKWLEWSITTRNFIYYENDENPEEILCMFCYNLCRNKPEEYTRKSDETVCRNSKCSCNHPDYLKVFELMMKLTKVLPFKFENFTGIQFINMLLMSSSSFENSFHRLLGTLNNLSYNIQKLKKKDFNFSVFINNSPFMKALEQISNILDVCKDSFYTSDILNCSNFIFPLLQRKFNYKSQENIWMLKKNLFNIFHKINFRKDFEKLPILSVKDLSNLNPFQRIFYCDYIHIFQEIESKYFFLNNNDRKTYVDEILYTLEKYKSIKDKNEHTYEILRKIYSQCKKIMRFNMFTNEQSIKFYSLNDEIISNSMFEKIRRLKVGYSKIRMLSQMIKCLLYMCYYYNDNVLKTYLNNELSLNQIFYFHSKNETSKMIYKNNSHILLLCRTIHQKYVINKKDDDSAGVGGSDAVILKQTANRIRLQIDKFHNKIMFMSTDITAMTLNDPDAYQFGLKRLLNINSTCYHNYINNHFNNNENKIIDELKKMCKDIENLYQKYFLFEITNKDIQDFIVHQITNFFNLVDCNDFSPPFNINDFAKKKARKSSILNIFLKNNDNKKDNSKLIQANNRILINKTPIVFTLIKSLSMILTSIFYNKEYESEYNNEQKISTEYINKLFKFLGYYVYENSDNCLIILTDRILKSFLMLNTDNIVYFINLLEYMVKIIMKDDIHLSQNNVLMRVLEELVRRISGKSEYVDSFEKLLKIISKLSKMNYLHQEHTLNKIRKTMKNIYKNNPILKNFKNIIIPNFSPISNEKSSSDIDKISNLIEDENHNDILNSEDSKNDRKLNTKTLLQLIKEKVLIDGYEIETLTILFTKFLKLINYLFDGNSTLNELDFLNKIFTKEQIPQILNDTTLYLPLRIELIKFFRISYVDVLIDTTKLKEYVTIFFKEIKTGNDTNFSHFIFFQELLNVKDKVLDMKIEADLFIYELTKFPSIIENNGVIGKKKIIDYFEYGIILPLQVLVNKYISIIYSLNGHEYIKYYEIIVRFLITKKYIIEKGLSQEQEVKEALESNNIFQTITKNEENKLSLILKKIDQTEILELDEDIKKLKEESLEILNYKLIYFFFEKHIKNFINTSNNTNLKEFFKKKTISDEEIEIKREEYKKQGLLNTDFKKNIFDFILHYEVEKNNFEESSLSQNLNEKNVLYNATYRAIILRPLFFLINSENLYLKYRRQNLWHIFRLLQYDTGSTQDDILNLRKSDLERIKKRKPKKEFSKISTMKNKLEKVQSLNSLHSSYIEDDDDNTIQIKPTVNLNYLVDLFIQNLLSIIFESVNPTTTANNEDYTIAYMVIKIMKYMCEDHNINFQTLFFKEILIDFNGGLMNIFDLMMCALSKILILSKWENVNYETEESSISYFYEIFFCMIEFAIEMIQGTTKENIIQIIDFEDRKDDKSLFYNFLVQAKSIIKNNSNDNEILYDVRLDLINFISAFVEEKSTPEKIINLLESVYNPNSIFDCIICCLKKLYLKTTDGDIKKWSEIEFDNEKCNLFKEKYFSDSEFSQHKEFELANRMYNYVKQLANFNNKDAKNIIDSINLFSEDQIIILRKKRENNKNDENEGSESVMIEPKYFQNYFAVKFFEAITRTVWIQGKEEKPQMILFTLDPTVLFLSEDSKNIFFDTVQRDSRSNKLFALIEYTNYFFIEVNQNKKIMSGKYFLKFINSVNYSLMDILIFIITAAINIVIYMMGENKDKPNKYEKLYNIIFPLGIIQLIFTLLFFTMWMISKFNLYFSIEKEKYFSNNKISKDVRLNLFQYLDIIILKTLLNKREIINFLWNILFSLLGITSRDRIFVFSIQLLIIVNINSKLQNITKVLVMKYDQILTYLFFLLIANYIFGNLAFFLLSENFFHELENNTENACSSLFYCFLTQLEFGLRTDGGIGEFTNKISFLEEPKYFMGMFFYQFFFFVIIVIIMLAVIGGVVIDTFAELREKSQKQLYDMNNVCYICSGNKNDIEKKGESFKEHITEVHNIWTYVDYMIGLKFVDPQETNAINSFVIEQLENKKISWFPSFEEKDEYLEDE